MLYNGAPRWSAVHDIGDLIPKTPGILALYKPSLKYLLIEENAYRELELTASTRNLVAAIFKLEHWANPNALPDLVGLLHEWLADQPRLRRTIAIWIRAALMRRKEYRIVLPEIDDLQEIRIMLADRMEEWAKAYRAEGMREGMQKGIQQGVQQGVQQGLRQGEALALQRLLVKRFGALSDAISARIADASSVEIETWFDRAIDAKSVDEIFDA